MWKIRYTIVLLIFIPFLLLFGQNDWVRQNPLPQGSSMKGVKVLDNNNIIGAGDVSTVIKTTDGGNNWDLYHHINNLVKKTDERMILIRINKK